MPKQPNAEVVLDDETDQLLQLFGARLKIARKKAGLTQAVLGAAAGLTQGYIFEVENRGSNMTLRAMIAVANACEVSLKDLFPDSRYDTSTNVEIVTLVAELVGALSACKNDLSKARLHVRDYLSLAAQIKELSARPEEP